jgi:hypothetical protein
VRGSSFSVMLLAFPAIGRAEEWAAMSPDLPTAFGGARQAGARILKQRLML